MNDKIWLVDDPAEELTSEQKEKLVLWYEKILASRDNKNTKAIIVRSKLYYPT